MASTGPSRVQVIHFGNYSNGEGMNRRSYRFDRRAPYSILISTAEKALPKMSLSSSAPLSVVVHIDASIFPSWMRLRGSRGSAPPRIPTHAML